MSHVVNGVEITRHTHTIEVVQIDNGWNVGIIDNETGEIVKGMTGLTYEKAEIVADNWIAFYRIPLNVTNN